MSEKGSKPLPAGRPIQPLGVGRRVRPISRAVVKNVAFEEEKYTSFHDIGQMLANEREHYVVLECYKVEEVDPLGGGFTIYSTKKAALAKIEEEVEEDLSNFGDVQFIAHSDYCEINLYNGSVTTDKVFKFYGFTRSDFDNLLENNSAIQDYTEDY